MVHSAQNGPNRDGDCLVMTEGTAMPARCPLCNSSDVAKPLDVRFAVQRKGGIVGKLVSDGIDYVKGWNYTGPVVVRVSFCRRHRARRTYALIAGLLMAAVGAIAMLTVSQPKARSVLNVLPLAAVAIGAIITLATLSGALNLWFKPRRFDDRTVWVSGASKEFLDSLTG